MLNLNDYLSKYPTNKSKTQTNNIYQSGLGGGKNYNLLGSLNSKQNIVGNYNDIFAKAKNIKQNVVGDFNKVSANSFKGPAFPSIYTRQAIVGSDNSIMSQANKANQQIVGNNNVANMDFGIQGVLGRLNSLKATQDNSKQIGMGGNEYIAHGNNARQIAMSGNNTLIANGLGNYQVTGSGDDNITSGSGTVMSGAGNDTVSLTNGTGKNYINLGAGDDTANIVVNDKNSQFNIEGGPGHDQLNVKDATATTTNWNINALANGPLTNYNLSIGDNSYVLANDVEGLRILDATNKEILAIANLSEYLSKQSA